MNDGKQWIIWEDILEEMGLKVGLPKRVDLLLGRKCWWRHFRWKRKDVKHVKS